MPTITSKKPSMSDPAAPRTFERRDFLNFFVGSALFAMLTMIVIQEFFGAATTWLVIEIARDISDGSISPGRFGGIVVTQTLSYVAGAISWIFAERAGFGAYSRYMLYFARRNRFQTALLGDSAAREASEPFLTSETFHVCFELIFTLQFHLRLVFQLVFNAIILGVEIDGGLPLAFAAAFGILAVVQWCLRNRLAHAYLENQRATNRMTARTYNAWDNVFSGNRYNFGLWHRDFRGRLHDAVAAQVRAISLREGWAAVSGLIALVIVLAATAAIAVANTGDRALLIALAATLPRQIEMTFDIHQLTSGFSDLVAVWTRIGGVCDHLLPRPAAGFLERIGFGRLFVRDGKDERVCTSLADAMSGIFARQTGLVAVRGGNGSGKSTLLAALKARLRGQAYYWPTQDRLAFAFNSARTDLAAETFDDVDEAAAAELKSGYSSGERQVEALREIVAKTAYPIYLFDEWDANLDAANRSAALALVEELALRARVIEVSHRDQE
jgi:hypothetical protein